MKKYYKFIRSFCVGDCVAVYQKHNKELILTSLHLNSLKKQRYYFFFNTGKYGKYTAPN